MDSSDQSTDLLHLLAQKDKEKRSRVERHLCCSSREHCPAGGTNLSEKLLGKENQWHRKAGEAENSSSAGSRADHLTAQSRLVASRRLQFQNVSQFSAESLKRLFFLFGLALRSRKRWQHERGKRKRGQEENEGRENTEKMQQKCWRKHAECKSSHHLLHHLYSSLPSTLHPPPLPVLLTKHVIHKL